MAMMISSTRNTHKLLQSLSQTKPIFISLFSTTSSPQSPSLQPHSHSSSSSSSQRRQHHIHHEEESRQVRVSVWWDFENCCVPSGINVFKISQCITAAVRANSIKGPVHISAFGDILCLSRANQEALSSTGVNLIHVPNGSKNSADRSLLVDLMYWVSQNPPPAHIFLISGDRDFAGILHRLRMNNYNILLAGKDLQTPGVLCSAATVMWNWNELAKGEKLSGRHFNQPPDGPFNSWYGYYRGPLEDPYELPEPQKNSKASGTSNVEPTTELKCRPVPKAVQKQIRQILNSYPAGLAITDLRAQLASKNVTLDKEFYGYKKFSRFLQSMPRIVKVVAAADGQFFLRPVFRKASDPVEDDDVSEGSTSENESQVIAKANGQSLQSTETVNIEPVVRVTTYDDANERRPGGKKLEVIPKKVQDSSQRDNRVAVAKDLPPNEPSDLLSRENPVDSANKFQGKEELNATVVKNAGIPKEEQHSKNEVGVVKRSWTKWFSSSRVVEKASTDSSDELKSSGQQKPLSENADAISPQELELRDPSQSSDSSASNVEKKDDLISKSTAAPSFISKVVTWCRIFWNGPPINAPTNQVIAEPIMKDDSCKLEGAQPLSKHEDASKSRKHELFLKDTFWSTFESFLKTYRGSEITLNSNSREQLAKRLLKDGPLVLRSLQETDIHDLVEKLISEKKWIKELPTEIPRFRINLPSVKSSPSVQPKNQNGLSSLFSPSSQSVVQKKSSEKSRSEILADCQKLLDGLLQQYPEGINMSAFKKKFMDKYGYNLDYQKLGYPKLASLLQIMPGVKVESCFIYSDSVVYAPGIASLGSKEKSSSSDSDMSESQWDELGPVENSDAKECGTYEPSTPEDDELSDSEDESSSEPKQGERNRTRGDAEDSSLLQILNSWYGTNEGGHPPQEQASEPGQDSAKCSNDGKPSGSSSPATGFKDDGPPPVAQVLKQKPQKTYMFVSDSPDANKDRLIDGILGSLKKNGNELK